MTATCSSVTFLLDDVFSTSLSEKKQGTCANNVTTDLIFDTWKVGYNHYHNRKGISLPNTEKLIIEMMKISEHEISWLQTNGAMMMSELGIEKGNSVVDFGSGEGRYTIPLSQLTSKNGQVFSFERDKDAIAVLTERLSSFSQENNVHILNADDLDITPHINGNAIDAILAFDVLQYIQDWDLLFSSFHGVLKSKGSFHIYPAALPHPGSVDMELATSKLEKCGFEFVKSGKYRMMHNVDMVDDMIYSFRQT